MYILHRRTKRTRILAMLAVFVALFAFAVIVGKNYVKGETTIGETPAATVFKVYDSHSVLKHFDEPTFSFDLPRDWEATSLLNAPAGSRSWHNTADSKGVRLITLFVDTIPPNFAINRVVAIQPMEDHLTVLGEVSDNCTNFTDASKQPANTNMTNGIAASVATGTATGSSTAKWQGVNFVCDIGNYLRNVVGTGTAGSLNVTKLTGPVAGTHSVFWTYTDNSASPNFDIFTAMLQSFKLK